MTAVQTCALPISSWQGGGDLDVVLIAADGTRLSWLGTGTPEIISFEDAVSPAREALGVLGAKAGEYAIEVVRAGGQARGAGEGTVRGEVIVRAADQVRTIPFVLQGARVTVGALQLSWKKRLERAWDVPVQ